MTASRVHATRTKHGAQGGIHERLPHEYNHSLVFPEFTDFDPFDTHLQNLRKSGGSNSPCKPQATKPIPIPGAEHIDTMKARHTWQRNRQKIGSQAKCSFQGGALCILRQPKVSTSQTTGMCPTKEETAADSGHNPSFKPTSPS